MLNFASPRSASLLAAACATVSLFVATPAIAQLHIDITSGVTDPIPVAVVPMNGAGEGMSEVISADLARTGRFRAIAARALPAQPQRSADLQQATWRAAGADYVVLARVAGGAGQVLAEVEIVNVLTNQRLTPEPGQRLAASTSRQLAHLIADLFHQKVLGIRGAFATRLAYVSVDGSPPSQHFQLLVADADGANPHVVLDSRQPIMSPAWSPDGEWLAYVSFEGRMSGV